VQHVVKAPRTSASEHQVQEDEAKEDGVIPAVTNWKESAWKMYLEVRDGHLARQQEGDRTRE
jgi:hypothetical protein